MKRLLPLLLTVFLLTGCTVSQPTQDTTASPEPLVSLPEPEPPKPTVAHLMVAGDAMSHMPLTNDVYVQETGQYDYGHVLAEAAQQLEKADYAVANLETVLAGGPKYSGFPAFNSPDGLATSLKAAGLDLLSTANNHSRDKGLDGIFRTLDVLDENGLAHVGTYRSQEERDQNSGIHVADVGGISVAFLSYTYGLNGYQLPADKMFAVNLFNKDYYTTLEHPDYEKLQADMEAARALNTDLIAVIMHWGTEYQYAPNVHQSKVANFLVEQGADLVLGGHPHVLQPYETITVTGWDGQERQGFVCWSLGNFISNQLDPDTKTTVILDLELTRDPVTEKTTLTDVRYTPYYMLHQDNKPVGQRRHLLDVHKAMTEYEHGDTSRISSQTYEQLSWALGHCHKILGEEGDRPSA